MSYIRFQTIVHGQKTNQIGVYTQSTNTHTGDPNDTGSLLGVIKWFGPWRGYAFFVAPKTIFEWKCLREIANHCEILTKEHRERGRAVRQKEKAPG